MPLFLFLHLEDPAGENMQLFIRALQQRFLSLHLIGDRRQRHHHHHLDIGRDDPEDTEVGNRHGMG
jgi:hypothetical protein